MIRIKAVVSENILEVCELTTKQDGVRATAEGRSYYNALSIAEAKYDLEMHPNAIYNNNVLIGFFMYQRVENQADIATVCRFMVDNRFQKKGLEEKALEHILRGLKIQGVKKVIFFVDDANEEAKNLYLSFGFDLAGKNDNNEYYYELAL